MSLTADAKTDGARAEHVHDACAAGASAAMLDYRPVAPRVLASPVLHVLLLVAVIYGYNRAVYANHWVTSRPPPYFSDVAAPLYAQLEDWVSDALMPPESANWAQFFHEFGQRLRWI